MSVLFEGAYFRCRPSLWYLDGRKNERSYYRDNLLAQKLLPDIRRISQSEFFVSQQDGAPAHRARDTVSFLERETLDFMPPTLWPPNSPDLNPVDYSIWCAAGEGLPLQNSERQR